MSAIAEPVAGRALRGKSGPAAPVGRLVGAIADSATNEGLGFAQVIVLGTRIGTVSDDVGRFVIRGVPTGRQRLRFSALGFQTVDSSLDVVAGMNLPIHVWLADRFPPPECQPCFWVDPYQGARAVSPGATALDYVGERWRARVAGRSGELIISSDPDPCRLLIEYRLRASAHRSGLSAVDSAGAIVREFEIVGGGYPRSVVWDGTDGRGVPTPYGPFLIRLTAPGEILELRCARVKRPPWH